MLCPVSLTLANIFEYFLISAKYLIKQQSASKSKFDLNTILKNLQICEYIECFLLGLLFVYDPGSYRYMYSMVHEPTHAFWVHLPFWIYELTLYAIVWHLFTYNIILMLIYWRDTSYWLLHLRLDTNSE